MSLGRRGPEVVRPARQHGERLAVTALDVEHPRHVPAAVRGDRPARLDAQRLARPRGTSEPAPAGGPVELLPGPAVVHRHPAAEVELRLAHSAGVTPLPGETEHPRRGGEQRGCVETAGQMRVQPAQPQSAGRRVTRRKPARAVIERQAIHTERRGLTPHDELAAQLRSWRVDPEQDVDGAPRGQRLGPEETQLVRALHVEAERARPDGGAQLGTCLARSAERETAARRGQFHVPQFAAGTDLESVAPGGDGPQQHRIGVGLGRVAELDSGRNDRLDGGQMRREPGQVVDIRGEPGVVAAQAFR